MAGKWQPIRYARVSNTDRNRERQVEHVVVDRVFTDKASGKDVPRVKPLAKSPDSERPAATSLKPLPKTSSPMLPDSLFWTLQGR